MEEEKREGAPEKGREDVFPRERKKGGSGGDAKKKRVGRIMRRVRVGETADWVWKRRRGKNELRDVRRKFARTRERGQEKKSLRKEKLKTTLKGGAEGCAKKMEVKKGKRRQNGERRKSFWKERKQKGKD